MVQKQQFTVRLKDNEEDQAFLDYCNLQAYKGTLEDRDTINDEELKIRYEEFDKNDPLDLTGHVIFIAETEQGERAGLIWLCEREPFWKYKKRLGWIYNIYVCSKFRRQGLGRTLLTKADEWAQEQKLDLIGLHVIEWNKGARKLYESFGYTLEVTHNTSRFYEKSINCT